MLVVPELEKEVELLWTLRETRKVMYTSTVFGTSYSFPNFLRVAKHYDNQSVDRYKCVAYFSRLRTTFIVGERLGFHEIDELSLHQAFSYYRECLTFWRTSSSNLILIELPQ